jgi:DNA protecting protein DprA
MSVEVSKNYQERRFAILHLSLIEGVGPGAIATILKYGAEHSSLWENFYQLAAADWRAIGISEGAANLVQLGLADKDLLDRELTLIEKHAVRVVMLGDSTYPDLLAHIHTPPVVLYYQGAPLSADKVAAQDAMGQKVIAGQAVAQNKAVQKNIVQKNIAIVGSRAADSYAERVIANFVPELVARQFTIVSGGALGADTMAHKATLEAGGRTVAILGSGLLQAYPRGNLKLFERIVAQGGSLVSSFPLLVEPHPHNFPARNRIISGMSSGCIVVQAAAKSGASITAEYALQQGRQVFAVPGVFDHPLSEGCHALLKEGAAVAGSIQDILLELGEIVPEKKASSKASSKSGSDASANSSSGSGLSLGLSNNKNAGLGSAAGMSSGNKSGEQQVSLIPARKIVQARDSKSNSSLNRGSKFSTSAGANSGTATSVSQIKPDTIQDYILALCAQSSSIDFLAQQCNLSVFDLQQLLFDLQLDGAVRQEFTGQWVTI